MLEEERTAEGTNALSKDRIRRDLGCRINNPFKFSLSGLMFTDLVLA